MDICPCCGDEATFGVAEVFLESRELILEACCEENLSGWVETIASWSRRERARWMLVEAGLHVREVVVTGEVLSWTLDCGLRLDDTISFADAKEFIREHHRHCAPPVGWKYGVAVFNGHEIVGVMTAGRPVSQTLARKGYIEVNRVCVKDCTPHDLVKDACSMLYGYACREAFQRGCERVVSYTLASESGAALRAAGFVAVARTQGGTWDRAGRPREDKSSTEPKIRWERWRDGATLPVQLRLALAA